MAEEVKEGQLEESITNKIDAAFEKKKAEKEDAKVDNIIDEMQKRYEDKFKEMEAAFETKLNSVEEKFKTESEAKDAEAKAAKDALTKVQDGINERKSLTADDAPQDQGKPKTLEEYRKWYRELPEAKKVEVDTEFFNAKLARSVHYR